MGRKSKLKYKSIIVKETASAFLENLENQRENWTWKELQDTFLKEFQLMRHDTIKLDKKKTRFEQRKFESLTIPKCVFMC